MRFGDFNETEIFMFILPFFTLDFFESMAVHISDYLIRFLSKSLVELFMKLGS